MKILGLDPSLTAFGWALHDPAETGPSRCIARGRWAAPSSQVFVDRYVSMRENVRALIQEHAPDRVGVESPHFHDLFSEGMYGLFLYVNEALRLERRDVVFFSSMQVKAHARELLGRPAGWTMLKPDMVEAAKKATETRVPWNHNEADAYLIAQLAGRFWRRLEGSLSDAELTGVERKFFSTVHTYIRGKKAGKTEARGLLYREEDRFFRWSERE